MKDSIDDYPVVIELPISWGDMDAFQHVNNVVYFKHFESARIAYFEKIHYFAIMEKTGIGPILASTQCRYKVPLTYPDVVSVGARVDVVEEDRFNMKYVVVSHQHQKIAASGEGFLVSFNYRKAEKAPLPDEIRKSIIELEKSVGQNPST